MNPTQAFTKAVQEVLDLAYDSIVADGPYRTSAEALASIQTAANELVISELQIVITNGLCLRPDCNTIHYKHAYEVAASLIVELREGL